MQSLEDDERMVHVIALFRPMTYDPFAESKYQRNDEAPHLEYAFMPDCIGPRVLLDNFFVDVQGSDIFPTFFVCVCACVCVSRIHVRAYLAILCVSADYNVKHTKSNIRYENKINKMKQM